MSSATSTDTGGLRAWHVFVVFGMAGASAVVMLAKDTRPENLIMLALTAVATIWAGIAFHRTFAPFAEIPVDDDRMLSERARSALEREKALVLRSIKELEFDRAMGKIADADFADMAGRLRARAIGLMRQLDEEAAGYRGLVERDLRARLRDFGEVVPESASRPVVDSTDARTDPAPQPTATATSLACSACGTVNDPDARFCKSCGAKINAFAVTV